MATMTFTAADIWCKCSASGGKDTQTGTIAVSGIPAGATIQKATLNFFVSYTYSSPYINRVSVNGVKVWEDYQPGSGNKSVDVTGLFTGAAMTLECYAQNGSSNTKRSNTAYTGITLVVAYIIPKSSFTLDKTSLDAGGSLTVNISRLSGSYTHRVTVALGTRSLTQTDVADQAVFSLPPDWCDQLPNAAQGQGTVTVETFLDGVSMGANAANFTLAVPASVVPSIGSLTATLLDGAWGLYVQGHSRCRLTAGGVAGAYGSTVTSVVISGDGSSGSGAVSSWDSHVLRTAGNVTFTATVTDSRGRTAQKTVTIAVTPYAPVAITGRVAARCQADGTEDRSGTSILAGVGYTMTDIGDNAATVKVHWRTGGGAWTEIPDWPAASGTERVILAGTVALDSAYEVRFTVADALTTAEQIGAVSVAEAFMVWSKKHKSFGFGSYPEGDNCLQIADDWALMAKGRDLADNAHHFVTGKRNIHTDWNGTGLTTTYIAPGQMTNQPSSYGQILSIVDNIHRSDKSQLWFTQNTGDVYHRQGNGQGWGNNQAGEDASGWVRMVDADNCKSVVGPVMYPVGAVYMSLSSTSPASLFGGTWQQLTDVFLLAAGGSYGVGSYGGATGVNHAHNEGNLAAAIGASNGDIGRISYQAGNLNSRGPTTVTSYTAHGLRAESVSRSFNHHTRVYGTTEYTWINTMPPYYAVYMWRRIG